MRHVLTLCLLVALGCGSPPIPNTSPAAPEPPTPVKEVVKVTAKHVYWSGATNAVEVEKGYKGKELLVEGLTLIKTWRDGGQVVLLADEPDAKALAFAHVQATLAPEAEKAVVGLKGTFAVQGAYVGRGQNDVNNADTVFLKDARVIRPK